MTQLACLFIGIIITYFGVISGIRIIRMTNAPALRTFYYGSITAIGIIILWYYTNL